MANLWKVNCMEHHFPGMWQRWFKHQCVAVGWAAAWGFKLHGPSVPGRSWSVARNRIKEIRVGDHVVVALQGNKVGRIGEVTGKAIKDDDWDPLVPPGPDLPDGEMGRRIYVRWNLTVGPDDRDLVVQLPERSVFVGGERRSAVSRITSRSLDELRLTMDEPSNWVSLLGRFGYERSLSDYIAAYPHRLEDGLLAHPNAKIRERVFRDHSRLDVLLIDREGAPVIVECKQDAPTISALTQLRHYVDELARDTGQTARGILVHGGAQTIRPEVRAAADQEPKVGLVRYRLEVDFAPSY